MIENIKINVAYSNILVYDENNKILYPSSNLSSYDIHPWYTFKFFRINEVEEELGIKFPYTLQASDPIQLRTNFDLLYSQNFEGLMDNSYRNFSVYSLDEIYSTDKNFIYPFILFTNELFEKYDTIDIEPRVIECVKNKRAKIVFLQATEGFFGRKDSEMIWISELSKKYNFDKSDVLFISANLLLPERYQQLLNDKIIIDNYTVIPYSFFQYSLWFHKTGGVITNGVKDQLRVLFETFITKNRNEKKHFHFLCFNRCPKPHRLALFGELMTNEKFVGRSIKSLGGCGCKDVKAHFNMLKYSLNDDYKYSKERLLNFFDNYDATKHYVFDEDDLHNNKAANINIDAHTNTFVNIVTESLIEKNTVFFSEKIFKPIYCAQPFILFGNAFSLIKLREYGFKTFDKWWDESYDLETDFTRRLEKIVETLEYISSWDTETCYRVTQEMEETLRHNFEVMISNEKLIEIFKLLES